MIVRIENSIDREMPVGSRLSWFKRYPPFSLKGRYLAAQSLLQAGEKTTGERMLRLLWAEPSLSLEIERELLGKYRQHLSRADHKARLENLLWQGQRDSASRMYKLAGRDLELLGRARLALRYDAPDVEWAIARVPKQLRNDPGLFYERSRWRLDNGKPDTALDLARATPNLAAPGGNPGAKWWKNQEALARLAITGRDYKTAYRMAITHAFKPGQDTALFAEAEWLAGWIALNFLDRPKVALPHFTRLYEAVTFPTMRARGAYWSARAAAALGDAKAAAGWYASAAGYPSTFYGQLAMTQRAGAAVPRTALDNSPMPDKSAIAAFAKQELAMAVKLLLQMQRNKDARQFFEALLHTSKTPQSFQLSAMLATSLNRPDFGVLAARLASREGVWLFEPGYPVITLARDVGGPAGPEIALILALSRQESSFNPEAISPAGARGLMQLMPATAREVARSLRVKYEESLLTNDPAYNTRLGSTYLSKMLRRYDGSYVMALAAYNAGGSRVNAWSRLHGDPRRPDADVIEWIELIPFSETRNYVQRVMENVGVYRLRLGNAADPFRLDRDLARGRTSAQTRDAPVSLKGRRKTS